MNQFSEYGFNRSNALRVCIYMLYDMYINIIWTLSFINNGWRNSSKATKASCCGSSSVHVRLALDTHKRSLPVISEEMNFWACAGKPKGGWAYYKTHNFLVCCCLVCLKQKPLGLGRILTFLEIYVANNRKTTV